MTWCLIKSESLKVKERIKSGELNPITLAAMTSAERFNYFKGFLSEDNAKRVNALFESKLLLKSQQKGMVNWAKQITGIKPQVRQDIISKINKMSKVLNPTEEKAFLHDLVTKALGFEITPEEAKNLSELSTKTQELKSKANSNGVFPTETDRLKYGFSAIELKKYIDELKLGSKNNGRSLVNKMVGLISEIPGTLKSAVASLDNSFWGRQGIKTFWDIKTTPIWIKNFLKSWVDMSKQLMAKGKIWTSGDDAVMDSIKADIISRPNSVNGKYQVGGYGLDVMSEEAYPSSLPEKIPLLGRLFKTSETMYNGGALRLRADLADRIIKMADENNIDTLDPKEAKGLGRLVSSMTGRGPNYLHLTAEQQKGANVLLFSLKFAESNIDTLTAPLRRFSGKTAGEKFANKKSAESSLRIIASLGAVLTIVSLLNKDNVDNDPRSTNFGKIKIFGHWTDISGGMGSYITLALRLIPTLHNGKWSLWTKSSNGVYTDLLSGTYGAQNGMDVFNNFWQGKLSPIVGIVRDLWSGQNYNGQVPNLENVTSGAITPLSIESYQQWSKDPASSFILGSLILDGLGFSTSSSIAPNSKTKLIPENQNINNTDLIKAIQVYAQAMGTDPETAFNRIFTGQKIIRVTNGTIIVKRMSLEDSTAVKKAGGGNNPSMKLDHTIPLELGGSNDTSNLKLVTTSEWSSYTPVENALGKALKSGKITKQQAQDYITQFKNKKMTKEQVLLRLK